jgi:hypothetical protein
LCAAQDVLVCRGFCAIGRHGAGGFRNGPAKLGRRQPVSVSFARKPTASSTGARAAISSAIASAAFR